MATIVTSKGRVTIPKRVRELLNIKPGSVIHFEVTPFGEVLLRHGKRRTKQSAHGFASLRGIATVKMNTDQILALTRGPKTHR